MVVEVGHTQYCVLELTACIHPVGDELRQESVCHMYLYSSQSFVVCYPVHPHRQIILDLNFQIVRYFHSACHKGRRQGQYREATKTCRRAPLRFSLPNPAYILCKVFVREPTCRGRRIAKHRSGVVDVLTVIDEFWRWFLAYSQIMAAATVEDHHSLFHKPHGLYLLVSMRDA